MLQMEIKRPEFLLFQSCPFSHCKNLYMYLNSSNKLNHVLREAMKSVKTSTFWFPECWLMKTRTPFSAIAGVAEMLKPNPGDVETMTTTSEEMLKPNRGETIDDGDGDVQGAGRPPTSRVNCHQLFRESKTESLLLLFAAKETVCFGRIARVRCAFDTCAASNLPSIHN